MLKTERVNRAKYDLEKDGLKALGIPGRCGLVSRWLVLCYFFLTVYVCVCQCLDLISLSSIQASQRCDDVDLHVMMFNEYVMSMSQCVYVCVCQCLDLISLSSIQASQRCDDVDLHVMMFNEYGKGLIKTFNVSPDAFIQLSLQLAYFRVSAALCTA